MSVLMGIINEKKFDALQYHARRMGALESCIQEQPSSAVSLRSPGEGEREDVSKRTQILE